MNGSFKIVVPSFNCIDFLKKNLASIEAQTYKSYDVCVIDDCSTVKGQRELILDYCQRNNWKYIFHQKNLGALAGIVEGIHSFNCQDDDVIVMVDGDDWLYNDKVLEKLAKIYTEEDVYLTWGSFESYPTGYVETCAAHPIDDDIIVNKRYREITDIFCHLKTYKYRLFREIKDEDLRDENHEYFRLSWDKALMYPMLEMAGHKIRFVPDILYVYNIDNPLNDFKLAREEQIAVSNYIRDLPMYSKLNLEKTK